MEVGEERAQLGLKPTHPWFKTKALLVGEEHDVGLKPKNDISLCLTRSS